MVLLIGRLAQFITNLLIKMKIDRLAVGSVTASPYLQFVAPIHKIIPFSLDMHTLKTSFSTTTLHG